MWIRFWCGHTNHPLINVHDDEFVWYDRDLSDDALKEEARERVHQWVWDCDAMTYYGFDKLTNLSDEVKVFLIRKYSNQIRHAQSMIDLLKDS